MDTTKGDKPNTKGEHEMLHSTTFAYEFTHEAHTYVLTDAGYSADGRLVRFTKWDNKGQLVDTDYVLANTFSEAEKIIKN